MIICDKKLLEIKGGSISSTLINSLARGVNTIMDLGRTIGTSINMILFGKRC